MDGLQILLCFGILIIMPNPESEIIERAAMLDLHAAADVGDVESLGIECRETGTALVSSARGLPASAIVVNRVLGLGLAAPATRTEVDAIVAAYRDGGVEQYFVQVHPDAGPPELVAWLRDAGLQPDRGWQKFAREPVPVEVPATDLAVREIGGEYGDAFAEIVCNGFDLGDAAIPWLAKLPGRAGWHVFMAFAGDAPAGVGALFVRDGVGWTDYGATAPEFRRRGSQGAVMAARLGRALELGCREIHTCTGVAVPGDPQHSYSNILRAGFRETYVRENFAPPAD